MNNSNLNCFWDLNCCWQEKFYYSK